MNETNIHPTWVTTASHHAVMDVVAAPLVMSEGAAAVHTECDICSPRPPLFVVFFFCFYEASLHDELKVDRCALTPHSSIAIPARCPSPPPPAPLPTPFHYIPSEKEKKK
jgi:hypothetical protein